MIESTESAKEMITNCPLIKNEKAFNITDLFDDSMKLFNLPITIMKTLEFILCCLIEHI